ncbi:MAG: DUF2752 domain-containing protein [Planctomycetota bacterium]|nr:DUF2752 domain-containing protein [Planctomycetota bacterium]
MSIAARALKALGATLRHDPRVPDRSTQLTFIAIFAFCLAAPIFFGYDRERGTLRLSGTDLPPLCYSRRLFDADCPGCGMARAFVCVAHGEVGESLRWHRLGLALYGFFAAQLAYRVWLLRRGGDSAAPRAGKWLHYTGWVLVGALVVNWLAGFVSGAGNGNL